MTVISLTEAAKLKAVLKDNFSVQLHFHDSCGGQYFSLDEPAEESLRQWIADYAEEKRLRAVFTEDRCGFYLVKDR
ncbi:RDAC family protein [Lacrimispora sp. 210928-DFI.3.58]|uniref:RDAC family protein n=1 Tax=Lacrimispora sp. 210928-DFI.3.58 TaxID=2883214 RepID=UPI0015B73A3F|nr:hypothetical protein [Lacrimispora sp. 210928-DFI.3.58]MCB7320655.1 hypothetical protein [Lacrimispora sp. 210928-DFI.3.58]